MYFPKLELAIAASLGIVFAAPHSPASTYTVKERHAVPHGWSAMSRPHAAHEINLQIGLKQQNMDRLEQHAVELSNPSHPRYGQYLTAAEIHELIAPSDETVELVRSWLLEHDVASSSLSITKDWIHVTLPVEKVEELLETTYSVYRHDDGSVLVRAPEWSLPGHLHEHIDVVQPTTSFFRMEKLARGLAPEKGPIKWGSGNWWKKPHPSPGPGVSCDVTALCNVTGTNLAGATVQATTLDCLRCLYGTIDYVPRATANNSVAVTNYLNETQVRSDIKLYLQKFRPEAASVADTFPIVVVANGPDNQNPTAEQIADRANLEGNLDGELVLGISWPTPFMSWVTGGSPPIDFDLNTQSNTNEPYLTWLTYVLAQTSIPRVISTSYGDDEQTVPYSYAKRVCDGFMQLGALGVSVIFGSGDSGVGPDGACISNKDNSTYMFLPGFPPSCPWITSVGGTASFNPEVAVSRFGSGAGFSNYFGMPAWQASTVAGYLSKIGNLYAGLYNTSGRAYPDVAAQGNHDVIVWAGNVTTIGGTSASAPAFAAIVALVNDALLAAGKPALGYLNPWIYGVASTAFTDILNGSSIGCDTAGFPATVGWDAVTGFGTPNFGKMVAAAFRGSHGHGGWPPHGGWPHGGRPS